MMLRSIFGALRLTSAARCTNTITNVTTKYADVARWTAVESRIPQVSLVQSYSNFHHLCIPKPKCSLLMALPQNSSILHNQVRTVTKFSRGKGKRKTVKAVLKRFYRLDWGGWIRTRSGRNKHLWRKSSSLRRRLRQHVFCNSTQSWMLDKMVTSFWRKPRHYVDDPYEPYHSREEFFITRKKPVSS